MRHAGPQALAPGRSSVAAGHVGRGPGLIDEHEARRVEIKLIASNHSCRRACDGCFTSINIDDSVVVMRPAFSIAENPTLIGIVSMSSFSYGYGKPK
jgi:hypothetical protein